MTMTVALDVPLQEFLSLNDLLIDKFASHPDRQVFRFLLSKTNPCNPRNLSRVLRLLLNEFLPQ